MKRPMLVSGITIALLCVLLTLYPQSAVIVLALGVLVLFLCLFKKSGLRKVILLPTCCVCAVITALSFFAYRKTCVEPCITHHNKTTSVQGKVITAPTSDDKFTYFTVKSTKIDGNNEDLKIYVTAPLEAEKTISLYDNVHLSKACISIPLTDKNQYDLTQGADGVLLTATTSSAEVISKAEKTPYFYCLKLKEDIKSIIDSSVTDNNGALLKGMLFGEKSQLDYNTTKAFRNSGIAHMLAVSGLHTSLWCGLLIALLKLLRCKEQIRSLICVLFLTAFCIISGFTPSVVRASVMASSTLIAPLFKRKADSFNSLGLAITLILVANPYVIHSISFRLSACATLGVLLSQETTSRINSIKYIPREKHLSHAFNYIISSVIISVFAGIFTLPVSAYHFGVFSIASPLSNIICVKPGFYGMITGIMGVILKAIPNTVTNSIGNVLFNITELILDFVVMVATAISKLSFCTIPVHKHRLLPAIIIIGIIAFTGYVIYKLVHSKTAIKITAVICVLTMAISIAVPLCVTKYKSEITIINDCNNIHLIIRSGTHYAYISNTLGDTPDDVHDFLPKATSESLDYYISTYMSDYKTYQLSSIEFRYEPLETRITKRIYRACISSDNPVPKNAVIKTTGKYELSDEISFEIIDTTPTQYVIIKSPEKTAYIHLHGNTDLSAVTDISQGNIFVYKGTPPEVISNTVETVVLSADSAITADENLSYIKSRCENFYITALDGNITLTI